MQYNIIIWYHHIYLAAVWSHKVHTVILSFALKLLRCLQRSFPCGRVEGIPQQLFPKGIFLPAFPLFLCSLYLITFSTQRTREAKNLFQKPPGATCAWKYHQMFSCDWFWKTGTITPPAMIFFPQQNGEKGISVGQEAAPGSQQPLWVGWLGEPLEEPSTAASILLRDKLLLVCYKQASWSSCWDLLKFLDTASSVPSRKSVQHHGKLQKQGVSLSQPGLLSSEDTIWITLAQAPQLRLVLQG